MTNELRIAAIQSNLIWEDIDANLDSFQQKINEIKGQVDLIILPEMFSTGFTMTPQKVAEIMDGKSVNWMKSIAKEKETAIVGSLVINENDLYYNRVVFMYPDGNFETYDKRHSFSLAGEDKEYTAGSKKLILDYKGWKICPLICYDLRFPVWSRNVENYDLLIYMANWPKPRILAWDSLLRARAIENMSYCVGVNRVGKDKNDYEYIGHTAAYGPLGEEIGSTREEKADVLVCTLNLSDQQKIREKLNFLNDKDSFEIKF